MHTRNVLDGVGPVDWAEGLRDIREEVGVRLVGVGVGVGVEVDQAVAEGSGALMM